MRQMLRQFCEVCVELHAAFPFDLGAPRLKPRYKNTTRGSQTCLALFLVQNYYVLFPEPLLEFCKSPKSQALQVLAVV